MRTRSRTVLSFVVLALSLSGTASGTPSHSTTWLGNTFGYGDGRWVQNHVNDLYVDPEGRVYTQSIWDEGHYENAVYRKGNRIGKLRDMGGGLAVTGDGAFVYAADGNDTSSVVRRFRPDGSPAAWPSGSNELRLPEGTKAYDLAAGSGRLFVSDPNKGRILVYRADTGAFVRGWPFTRPAVMAAATDGTLWIVQSPYALAGKCPAGGWRRIGSARILHRSEAGEALPGAIDDVRDPSALAFDGHGRLLVTEAGPDQQVRGYKVLGARPGLDPSFGDKGVFGVKGGVWSGSRGRIGPDRFDNLSGVGTDRAGNLYVSLGGPHPRGDSPLMDTDIRAFDPHGRMLWQLVGKEFVDMGDLDPDHPERFYTKDSLYVLDRTRTAPGTEWRYAAYTIDPWRYPDDPRAKRPGATGPTEAIENVYARRIGGRLFLFGNSMAGDQGPMRIFRFSSKTDGEIAIPCARIGEVDDRTGDYPPHHPAAGSEYIWRDRNANGAYDAGEYDAIPNTEYPFKTAWWPDSRGNLWRPYRERGIRKLECTGLDAHGIPVYRLAPRVYYPMLEPFTDVHKLRYIAGTDTMYLAGWTRDLPGPGGDQPGRLGAIARYDHWSTSPTLVWETHPEDRQAMSNGACFDVAGDYVFAVYGADDRQTVVVFRASDGQRVDSWDPGPEIGGRGGWVDIWDGGLRAHKENSGEYLVFVEEDWHNKTILYHWHP